MSRCRLHVQNETLWKEKSEEESLDLRTLTKWASFRLVPDISVHAWPHKTFLDEFLCGTNTWMREIGKRSKELRRREDGTNGLGLPVEMSQMRNTWLNVLVTRFKEFGVLRWD